MKSVKLNTLLKITFTLLFLTAVLFQVGCASQQTGKSDSSSEVAEVAQPEPAPDIVDDYDGDGMDMPLDGTSLDAFEASLKKVERNTSATNFKALNNAISYLMIYDLGAQNDRAKLAANLNGLTGFEVVGKVRWRKPAPGKGYEEKGSADAKIEY